MKFISYLANFALAILLSSVSFHIFAGCEKLDSLTLDNSWLASSDIEKRMQQLDIPGMSVAVIDGFHLECVKHYGVKAYGSAEAVDDNTLFQLASISKPMSGLITMRLVEQGKLSLDDNVNAKLRGWALKDTAGRNRDDIQVKHLLTHTAGLTVHGFPGYTSSNPIPNVVEILNGALPANTDRVEVAHPVAKQPKYSGAGTTVLQLLLQQVTGKSFQALSDELLINPLELKNSTFSQPLSTSKIKLAAQGFSRSLQASKQPYHIYPEQAAAGLWSSAKEFAQVVIEMQKALRDDSSKLISQSSAKRMLQRVGNTDFALGFMFDGLYFVHGGWNEGYSSRFIAHHKSGYAMVILTNANKPDIIKELLMSYGASNGWEDF